MTESSDTAFALNKWRAINTGTLFGFFGVMFIDCLTLIAFSVIDGGSLYSSISDILFAMALFGFYYLIFGLPIAYISCFTLGVPLWWVFNRKAQINKNQAMVLGALIGAILGSLNMALFIWDGNTPIYLLALDLLSTIIIGIFAGQNAYRSAVK